MSAIGNEILYLVSCALNEQVPDENRINCIDLSELFRICKLHSLSAIICCALESANVNEHSFKQEKNLAIRNIMLLDFERKQICSFFEENKIWHMPLKGVYLKEYYPKIGMRQMCDNDILVDSAFINEIDIFLKKRGYKFYSEASKNDQGYLKPPCYNFEIHTSLFGSYHKDTLYNYYKNIKEKLIKSENTNYEYHFSTEDFYIYMTAHEYKHFSNGGTGLRSLVDTYVYLNKFSDNMNWDYIHEECCKLEIAEYEEKARKLTLKLFSSAELPELTEDEQQMLDYYLGSGTYGTTSNKVSNKIEKMQSETGSTSKLKYILQRIFPPMDTYKYWFPFFYKHKILLPIGWAYRLIRGIFRKNNMIKAELKAISNINNSHD